MATKLGWVGSGCVALAVFYACSSPTPSPPRAGGITGGATGAGGTGGASLGGAGPSGGASMLSGGAGGTGGFSLAGGAGGTGGKATGGTGGAASGGAAGAGMGGTGGGFPMPPSRDVSGYNTGERGCNANNGCAGGVNLGAQGTAYREQWLNVPIDTQNPNEIESFTGCAGNPRFPDSPDRHDEIQNGLGAHAYLDKNTPPDGDNYADRVRGYILAPETGAYTFWLTSDNSSQLYISTEIPANQGETPPRSVRTGARAVAVVDNYALPGTFDQAGQKSQAVNMVAGSLYYFDLFYKEGQGPMDHWEVRWTLPNQAGTFARVPASALYTVTPIVGSGPAPCPPPPATGGASGTGGSSAAGSGGT